MSYDLMVFEPSAAPRGRDEFVAWYRSQTEWREPHGYSDLKVASPRLRAWYDSIVREFPNLQDPDLRDEDLPSPRLTDYSIGTQFIYACFQWPAAEDADEAVRRLAVEHGLGFYDPSGDEGNGEIHFPGDALLPKSLGEEREWVVEVPDLPDQEEE